MSSATGMEVRIDPLTPQVRPGVLTGVASVLDTGGGRWRGGVRFVTLGADNRASASPLEWCQPEDEPLHESTGEEVVARAFSIHASERCSTLSTTDEWLQSRNGIRMDLAESEQIAAELMTGAQGPNIGLIHAAALPNHAVPGGPYQIELAVTALEGIVTSFVGNEQMTFHVHPVLAPLLASHSLIRREGGAWVTTSGHLVAFDAGYGLYAPTEWDWDNDAQPEAEGADLGTSWIYVSGPVAYTVGDVRALDPGVASVDLTTNRLTGRATREALVVFDPATVFAVQVSSQDIETVQSA